MRVSKKLIASVVSSLAGEEAVTLTDKLVGKKNVSEFKIAKELKLEIQYVRSILYRLHNHNLVNYIRKKDRVKGWYVSYWTFDKKRIGELASFIEDEQLRSFKKRLNDETVNTDNFFLCPNSCIRLLFYDAVLSNYTCPECSSIMNQQDNTRTIDFLKQKIRELESAKATTTA